MPKICLNPGHFVGLDSGAVGNKSTEAELVMEYAKLMKPMLEKVGYTVLIANYNELYQIVNASDQFDADVFLSIHCNSAANASAYGTETFYYIDSTEGKKLASCVQNQIEPVMCDLRIAYKQASSEGLKQIIKETSNRGLKNDSLYVVRNTNAIAALVEIGFISNEMDEEILIAKKVNIASALARGITDYFAMR